MHRNLISARSARAALLSAAAALGIIVAAAASAATHEVDLATASQALAYCKSGKMPGSDIAYINGGPGLVQYGPNEHCKQRIPTDIAIKKAVQFNGKHASECNLSSAAQATAFCNGGSMGEYDIDYINGKVGRTISGPGYGCVVNYSSSSIGNAVCR
jgi:hypothetical protein